VNGVAFSPDGKLLASANANGSINMWNTPGPGSDWIVELLAALAIALAALTVLITTREIWRAGRGRTSSWRKLRPS
jgi:WD40 repeat protein